MESYNPHHEIAHPHVFIDVAFRLEDRELTIETLDYPDTYFVKWFTHVCCRGKQDQVEGPLYINRQFYLYIYGRGAHSIFVCPLVWFLSNRGIEQFGSSQGS
ncbi:hypothetical protein Gotur_033865 [Gossypium turneri]